jgi:hypothetical protein
MPTINIPLQASLETASWEGAVKSPDTISFWENCQTLFKGVLRNEGQLSFDTGAGGLIVGRDVITATPANSIEVNGHEVASFATAMFATDPVPLNYTDIHAHYFSGKVEGVLVTGTTAHWSLLDSLPTGEVQQTANGTTALANVSGMRAAKIIENTEKELLVIGNDMFAINNILYTFSIPTRGIRCVKVGTYYYITIEGQGTRRLPDNQWFPAMVAQTYGDKRVYFTAMGLPDTAHFYLDANGAGEEYETANFYDPDPADTIYSQTFHPLEPFTITRNDSDPADIVYDWVSLTNSRLLQSDGTRPTTDFNRTTDGLTSSVTGQFNRVYLDDFLGVVYQGGVPIAVSVNGCLVTPVGIDFNNFTYTKKSEHDYIIAIDSCLMRVSREVPMTIRQFSDFGLKVNVADPYNIIDLRRGASVLGSLDWNNRVKPEQVLALSPSIVQPQQLETVSFNSAVGANYEVTNDIGTSILVGSALLVSASPGWQVMTTWETAAWREVMNPRLIDFYFQRGGIVIQPEYVTTGFQFNKPELKGLRYVEPAQPMVPAPINASYQVTNPEQTYIDWGERYHNVGLLSANNPIDLYLMASMFNRAGVVFTISSQPYFFDGSIFALVYENRMLQSLEFIVNTDNMQFLGNDSTQAFFMSNDNFIWSFTGSMQLTAVWDMTRYDKYLRSSYNQNTDELAVQFADTIVCIRKGVVRKSSANKHDIKRLGKSVYGNVFYSENTAYVFGAEIDNNLQPFFLQTAFIGLQESDISSFSRVWFRCAKESTFYMKVDVLNEKVTEGNWIEFLKAEDGQVIPKQLTGRGLRVTVKSDTPVFLAHLEVEITKRGEVVSGRRVSH